jgi:hypothetical protein
MIESIFTSNEKFFSLQKNIKDALRIDLNSKLVELYRNDVKKYISLINCMRKLCDKEPISKTSTILFDDDSQEEYNNCCELAKEMCGTTPNTLFNINKLNLWIDEFTNKQSNAISRLSIVSDILHKRDKDRDKETYSDQEFSEFDILIGCISALEKLYKDINLGDYKNVTIEYLASSIKKVGIRILNRYIEKILTLMKTTIESFLSQDKTQNLVNFQQKLEEIYKNTNSFTNLIDNATFYDNILVNAYDTFLAQSIRLTATSSKEEESLYKIKQTIKQKINLIKYLLKAYDQTKQKVEYKHGSPVTASIRVLKSPNSTQSQAFENALQSQSQSQSQSQLQSQSPTTPLTGTIGLYENQEDDLSQVFSPDYSLDNPELCKSAKIELPEYGPDSYSESRSLVENQLQRENKQLVKTAPDGNCLFEAVFIYLRKKFGGGSKCGLN